jgi:hypothetical protein
MRGPAIAPLRPTVADPPDRRVREVRVRTVPIEVVRIKLRNGPIHPRLRSIDRCLQRWTVTPGATMSAPMLAQVRFVYGHNGRPSMLGDQQCEMVDRAILASPSWVKQIVNLWYRTDRPAREISIILGSSRRQAVYEHVNMALAHLQGRLGQMGLPGLNLDFIA